MGLCIWQVAVNPGLGLGLVGGNLGLRIGLEAGKSRDPEQRSRADEGIVDRGWNQSRRVYGGGREKLATTGKLAMYEKMA